ncbi:30S ribosomal protein S6 [bacterium]|nr:30S ribosomal protein S6 [bacterium]MCI0604630.1 30S ribosomal protein S6 [bacterium]
MSYYELLVIFSTNLSEDEEKTQASQTEDLITHEKGTIHLAEHWGKRKLAYTIKKQRQGYYEWFYFELDPRRIAEIDRKLKMSETILRFLIFKMEKIQIQNLHRELARREAAAAPPAPPEPVATVEPVNEEEEVTELFETPPESADESGTEITEIKEEENGSAR